MRTHLFDSTFTSLTLDVATFGTEENRHGHRSQLSGRCDLEFCGMPNISGAIACLWDQDTMLKVMCVHLALEPSCQSSCVLLVLRKNTDTPVHVCVAGNAEQYVRLSYQTGVAVLQHVFDITATAGCACSWVSSSWAQTHNKSGFRTDTHMWHWCEGDTGGFHLAPSVSLLPIAQFGHGSWRWSVMSECRSSITWMCLRHGSAYLGAALRTAVRGDCAAASFSKAGRHQNHSLASRQGQTRPPCRPLWLSSTVPVTIT